jgi:hypothetical protein
MKRNPDFFLSAASEMRGDLAAVRACWTEGRLRDSVRDDYMLVGIEPPVVGQHYGLGGEDITELVISARWTGYSLFPVTKWPSAVYVGRILDKAVIGSQTFAAGQIEMIGWGMIFRTADEAEASFKG